MRVMKQYLFVLCTLMSLGCFGQIKIDEDIVDEFTGNRQITTEVFNVAKGGMLKGIVGNFDETYVFYLIPMTDLGCSGATGNYVIFLFEDGSTLQLEDNGKIDCGSISTGLFLVKYEDFKNKKIKKLRVRRTERTVDYDWNPNTPNLIEILDLVTPIEEDVSEFSEN